MTTVTTTTRRGRRWCLVSRTTWAIGLCGCAEGTTRASVVRVELTPTTASMIAGRTLTLSALVYNEHGTAVEGTPLTWSTGNPSVALVSTGGVVSGVAPGSVQIAASTRGQSATATITVTPRPVATLSITPAVAQLRVGDTVSVRVQPYDDIGAPVNGRPVTWTTSDATVASVDAQGNVVGIAAGAATIVATCDDRTAQTAVTVSLPAVHSVAITPARMSMTVGTIRPFTATLRDATGKELPGRSVGWSSSNSAIATVSGSGVVAALLPGTAVISATSEGRTGTAEVFVDARPVATVTVSPTASTLVPGATLQLQARVADDEGNLLGDRLIAYESDAPSVATVNSSGLVTAIAPGTARVTVSSEGKVAVATIRVVPVPVASVEILPTSARVIRGDSLALAVVARAANGDVLTGRTTTWRSGASAIATVRSDGVVHALSPGVAIVLAEVDGATATSTITVELRAISHITISPAVTSLSVGASVQLTATPRDATGAVLTDRVVTWTSTNESVAFVSSAGLVVAFQSGTAMITARSEGISASVTIRVP